MDTVFMILIAILSAVTSIGSVIGAIFIYRVYIATCSIGEFFSMAKTQGYLKSLFRFDKLVSPKMIQFLYGVSALALIGGCLTLLIVALYQGIQSGELKLLAGGVLGAVVGLVVGEIFMRIGYEFAILLFKINENLRALRDAQVARGFITEEVDDRMASEALSDTFNTIRNTVSGNRPGPQGGPYDQPAGQQGGAQAANFCPDCGTPNAPRAKFCKGCGGSLT